MIRKTILLFLMTIVFTTIASSNPDIIQGNYRWRNDDGNIENATPRADENVNSNSVKETNIRLRVQLTNVDPNTITLSAIGLYYSIDSTNWIYITNDASNEFQLSLSSYFDEADTINDLLTNNVGYPHRGGFTIESTTSKSFTFDSEKSYEVEYCIKATSNAVVGNTYLFAVMGGGMDYHPLPKLTITSHINTTVFIEGPFNGIDMNTDLNSMGVLPLSQPYNEAPWNYFGGESVGAIPNGDVVDWVLVELRETSGDPSTALPGSTIAKQAAFLLKSGQIVDLDGISLPEIHLLHVPDNLYLVLWHRNHLAIMSSIPLVDSTGKYTYDFTDQLSKAYSEGQKEINAGIYGMIAGDIDGSGIIDVDDKNNKWSIIAGEMGYELADINLDGEINNIDKDDFWYVNIGSETKVPLGIIFNCGETLLDTRDDQTYTTVQIGLQCWMGENLNIGNMINGNINQTNNSIIEKYCYDNSTANCDIYGGLYQWDEMMQYTTTEGVQGICPAGWHLPTDAEWTVLTDFLGGESVAGGKMKTTGTIAAGSGLWYSPNTGATNSSGFTGLPGGYRYMNSSFSSLASSAYFSSSSEYGGSYAWGLNLTYSSAQVNHYGDGKASGFSARCLRY